MTFSDTTRGAGTMIEKVAREYALETERCQAGQPGGVVHFPFVGVVIEEFVVGLPNSSSSSSCSQPRSTTPRLLRRSVLSPFLLFVSARLYADEDVDICRSASV